VQVLQPGSPSAAGVVAHVPQVSHDEAGVAAINPYHPVWPAQALVATNEKLPSVQLLCPCPITVVVVAAVDDPTGLPGGQIT
jgi:hypothetical protein